jgi:hypothetical protein
LEWDPKHHERVLGDVVVKAIMEAVNNYFVDHDAEHIFYDGYRFCQVFIDSLDDPWIEGAYMVPVLTYCNERDELCVIVGLLRAGTDTASLRRFGVFELQGSGKNLFLILDSLPEEILIIY